MGLFQLTAEEWLADWNSQVDYGFKYVESDIDDWRNQCTLFPLMARRSLDECEKALGSRPSAVDLLLAQVIGAKATVNLKGAQDTLVKAIMDVVAANELPRGGLTPDKLMERHAKLLANAAGAPLKGRDVLTLVTAVLGAALTATKTLFPPAATITDPNSPTPAPTTAAATAAPANTLAMAQQAFTAFRAKNWTPEQACGIVANIQAESSFDFRNTSGDSGTAHGLCQWRGGRQTDFVNKFGHPIAASSFEEQLEFIDFELNNKEQAAGDALKQTTTPSAAAAIFCRMYERPQFPNTDSQIRAGLAEGYARALH
jgi:hypothetical protein